MTWKRLIKNIVALAALGAIGFVLYTGYIRVHAAALIVGVLLLAMWAVFCFFFIWQSDNTARARRLLRSFTYRVDRARQRHRDDTRRIDEQVVEAFDSLHTEVDTLLRKRRLRPSHLRRAVAQLEARNKPAGPRWQPPTLMEMGYALAATDDYQRDASVLALYKFSGGTRAPSGEIVNAYTILKEGAAAEFTGKFSAKVHSRHAIDLNAFEVMHDVAATESNVALVDVRPINSADSEHNVAYILSLLGPLAQINSAVTLDNLRAMAKLGADTVAAPALTAASLRGWQRSLLTERIGYLESSLPLARRALRQEPQLLAAAIADLLRDPGAQPGALADCTSALTDILHPMSRYAAFDLKQLLIQFMAQVQNLAIVPTAQALANPGLAFVDMRGAEANSALLKRIAELLNSPAHEAGERVFRVHLFSLLTSQAFQAHLRGFRELNGGAEGQTVIHTLLQCFNEDKLALHSVEGTQPLKAREFPRAAGHQLGNELFCTVNPIGFDVDGIASRAHYLLWTLGGHALHTHVDQLAPLLASAHKLKGYAKEATGN